MSEPTTYHIEHASSGRAKCKKCKIAIAKGELRVGTSELSVDTLHIFGHCALYLNHCLPKIYSFHITATQGPNDYNMTS